MARTTTLEEKKFIETKAEEGWTSRQIAQELKCSIWTVRKWRQWVKKPAVPRPAWGGRQQGHWALLMHP
jgi:transposase